VGRIPPLTLDKLPEAMRERLSSAQSLMGFTPNDALIMARWPELLQSVEGLVQVIYRAGELDQGLKRLMASMVSNAAGCRYCQAHTAHGAVRMAGVAPDKLAALWQFRSSPQYSPAERAALELAAAAGQTPNAATDQLFDELRRHYSERAIMEMVAVISLFGFLNRWNSTLNTELEDAPSTFAR
jgi:uncharacterized peroxidase-related enzyme